MVRVPARLAAQVMAAAVLATLLLSVPPFGVAADADGPAPAPQVRVETVHLEVAGLSATVTTTGVARALTGVPGVRSCLWSAPSEAVIVREVGRAGDAELLAAARAAGATAVRVPVVTEALSFVTKLRCGSCVKAVTKALTAVAGVKDVRVSADMTQVTVAFDSRTTTRAALVAALATARYPVQP